MPSSTCSASTPGRGSAIATRQASRAMGMTMIEKILARGAGRDRVEVGEFVVCEVDMTVLIDLQFATLWASPTRIADPDRLAVVMDHRGAGARSAGAAG